MNMSAKRSGIISSIFFIICTVVLLSSAQAQEGEVLQDTEATESVIIPEVALDETETAAPTPEPTLAATSVPTIEATEEVTAEPTVETSPEPTLEATPEITVEPTQATLTPPVFVLNQSVFDVTAGLPLVIELAVTDDEGVTRVTEDVSATLGGLSLSTSAPTETTAPFNTLVAVTYLAPAGYSGLDSFTLTAIDASGAVASTTIEVNVVLAAVVEATPEITPEATLPADAPMAPMTYIVNNTGDAADFANDDICDTVNSDPLDGMPCSLRAAIQQSNVDDDTDTIRFAIPNVVVATIKPETGLPDIERPIVMTGTLGKVILDGSLLSTGSGLLTIRDQADGTIIQGMTVVNFTSPSDSDSAGIFIEGPEGVVIQGNYIGNIGGKTAAPNNIGIFIRYGSNHRIGGTTTAARNIISGNTRFGIQVSLVEPTESSQGVKILGNYIGTNLTGTAKLGNGDHGIFNHRSNYTLIGGTVAGSRNLISGNGDHGIRVEQGSNNTIQGNYIGVNAAGTGKLSNGDSGIRFDNAADNIVGGTVVAARNIISGNENNGVFFQGSDNNTLQGNYIGTNVTGTVAIGNGFGAVPFGDGIGVHANNNVIGGDTPTERNLISGNADDGITIAEGGSGNQILGNYIGTNAAGTGALGNLGDGVALFFVSGNFVGGGSTAEANRIAYNTIGVSVYDGGVENGIGVNSIYLNNQLGIDLLNANEVTGVTFNDTDDSDTGANNRQNFPEITSITPTAINYTIDTSVPDGGFRVNFYSNTTCDITGYGEGQTYLGFDEAIADENGDILDGSFALTVALKPGTIVTATAISPSGNTSEFSECFVYNTTLLPAKPTPIYPLANSTVFDRTTTLRWNGALYAQTYSVEIANNINFVSPHVPLTSTGSSRQFTIPEIILGELTGGLDDGVWYWRVRGENGVGNGLFAGPFKFTIETDTAPTLTLPKPGTVTGDNTPTLRWMTLVGAKQYQIFWSADTTCNTSDESVTVKTTTYTFPTASYLDDGIWYWCVRGIDGDNQFSPISAASGFTITRQRALLNGSVTTSRRPTFSWFAPPGTGISYQLLIDNDADFTSPEVDVSNIRTTSYTLLAANALALNDVYYWRVIPSGSNLSWGLQTQIDWAFLVTSPALVAPKQVDPVNGSTDSSSFTWQAVTDKPGIDITYQIMVDNAATFVTPEINETVDALTYATGLPGAPGTRYYWKVRAVYDGVVYGPWSSTWSFLLNT
jgi:parallel beta-helix repeat protein